MSDPKEAIRKALDDLPLERGDVLKEFSYDGQDRVEADSSIHEGFWRDIQPGVMLIHAKALRRISRTEVHEITWHHMQDGWLEVSRIKHGPARIIGGRDA